MAVSFANGAGSTGASALNAVAVTPSDSVDLAEWARGIYLGGGGDLKVTTAYGSTVTLIGLAAGVVHPISARRIWATGTDATDIVAMY